MGIKLERQLAAVMFTDIVGYTALMQGDEQKAIAQRTKHREIFQQQHKLFGGDILQYYGDGTLSVFKSAVQATLCAIEIQRLLQQGDIVPLRIGLHLGDVFYNKTEVFGDGVNLAARIESLGTAGSILLSDKINDELKNQKSVNTISLGEFNLKNVTRPVEVFAISNQGIQLPSQDFSSSKNKNNEYTIAVLPFVNMSPREENEFFSDGITEEIINALSKINQLKVTSRTSSFYFKGKHVPLKQIAKELNASIILEGSVRLAGNQVRINAQLIEAEQDAHFWSESWDRKLENIFEIQDEISLLIADKIREQFGHMEIQDHLVAKQTDSVYVYEFYLKGIFHFRKWNPKDVEEAILFYQRALELDGTHIESYLGLADAYSFLAATGFMPMEDAWKTSIEMTTKAQEINRDHDGVHYQLANQYFFTACDFSTALHHALTCVSLNSNSAEGHQFLSFLYLCADDHALARSHLDLALAINPLSQETLFYKAYYDYMTGNMSDAITQLDNCLKQNPNNLPAHVVKCYILLITDRAEEVLDYFDSVPEEIVVAHDKLGLTALAHVYLGNKTKAQEYLKLLRTEAATPNGFRAHSYLLLMYAANAQFDEAFDWIEDAIKNKASFILFHFNDPLVHTLKKDSRYRKHQDILFPHPKNNIQKTETKELLDKETVSHYTEKLLDHMHTNHPYLDAKLSLRSLADQIDIHPNQLSWLLNDCIGKNFNEFINYYRVESFKRLARDPKNSQITLLGLAYDSGFNSKSVFNNYFKKFTGLTPKQYLKQAENLR